MKSRHKTQNYREVAQHLGELIEGMESLVANYNGINCTFAEALGQKGLSHEFDEGGRFYNLAEQFKENVERFNMMLKLLKTTHAEYEVLKLLDIEYFN